MWGLRSSRTLVIGVASIAFVAACLLPVIYMFGLAAGAADRVLAAGVLDARQRGLLSNTALLGGGSAALATAIGLPLGFVLARVDLPFKTLLRLALAAPAVLPPYVVALAWIDLVGTHSLAGAVVVLGVVFYPLAMLATEVRLRQVESRLEEAGLLVATPGRVLRHITLPLVAPTVLAAALVIFVIAISEFGVPGLLRVRVYTTEVFTAFAALYDFGRAAVLTVPLLILSIGIAAAAGSRIGGRMIVTRRALATAPPFAFNLWRRPAFVAIVCIVSLTVVLPVLTLGWEARRSASLVDVLRGSQLSVFNSLILAAVGATMVTAIGACLGYARARTSDSVGAVIDAVWIVLFTIPSTIVGIGLIGVWNGSRMFGALYGTTAMLVLGYLARFLPVAALVLATTIRSVPLSHEEAAAVTGAGWWRTVTRILLPQAKLALLAVWAMVFVLAFGEVGTSILVAPPGETTLPIRVYTFIANAPPGHVAALALFQSLVVFCPLILLGMFIGVRQNR